ncbi:phosphoribosyltransferase [Candidatus Daviesbacteria bacterium]|nr:phosphoribosyltransferase [Candidatus Daviesbacteria bacterium]
MFKDRTSAGKLLAQHLKNTKADLVLAIPRGGVVVGAEIAKQLNLPLDVIITRKIGAPNQPELALGAIDPDGEVVWDDKLVMDVGVKTDQLKDTIRNELDELARRDEVYRQGKESLAVENKTIILVDDGIATGSTTLAAINYLKRHQVKRVILAVPVGSRESMDKIGREIGQMGKVIVLDTPDYFQAVGQFYQQFLPVSDEEVIQLLR